MLPQRIFGVLLLLGTLSGCSDNPGTWPADKLEAHVKDSLNREGLNITEVTLTSAGEGGDCVLDFGTNANHRWFAVGRPRHDG